MLSNMFYSALEYLDFSGLQLLYFGLVILIAAVIRGYAGFGFSAIVVAAMSLTIASKEVVPIVIVLEILASLQMARSVWKSINWKLVSCILFGAMLLTPVGQMMLAFLPQQTIQPIIAGMVLFSVSLLLMGFMSPIPNKPWGWIFVGAIAGFFNGIAAMGGLAVMILLINTSLSITVLRASIITLFFFIDCYAGAFAIRNDILDFTALYRAIAAIPLLFIGIKLGDHYFSADHAIWYKRIALGILFALGLLLLLL